MATQIESVGIGTPGSVNPHTGVVEFNANFGYRNWPLVSAMEKLLPCRVYIENDANAAAYGEYIAGAAQGAKYAIAVTLGTGIGGGIIIDGKIFSGFNSAGAEIGHTVIVKGGRPCMCGRRGCWEKYASARALAEDTLAAMEQHKDNIMWSYVHGDPARVNAKTAFDAMRAGDALGTQVVQNFVEYVACGLTNLINIFQPEIICIGGGVSKEGDTLLAPVQAVVDQEDYAREGMRRTKIVTQSCAMTRALSVRPGLPRSINDFGGIPHGALERDRCGFPPGIHPMRCPRTAFAPYQLPDRRPGGFVL